MARHSKQPTEKFDLADKRKREDIEAAVADMFRQSSVQDTVSGQVTQPGAPDLSAPKSMAAVATAPESGALKIDTPVSTAPDLMAAQESGHTPGFIGFL